MKYAVISDIHANNDAFEAVLATIPRDATILCLGDAVGYGAEPNAIVDRLRTDGIPTVMGNHDAAAVGAISTHDFNDSAKESAVWTGLNLSPENRAWIRELPYVIAIDDPEMPFLLVHGSPFQPKAFNYVFDEDDAANAFSALRRQLCLIGHSHMPSMFMRDQDGMHGFAAPGNANANLYDGTQNIVNVGSVGQPRDGDPDACYAVLDTGERTIAWHRVAYDIASAATKIRTARLPERSARRLSHGE